MNPDNLRVTPNYQDHGIFWGGPGELRQGQERLRNPLKIWEATIFWGGRTRLQLRPQDSSAVSTRFLSAENIFRMLGGNPEIGGEPRN